MVPQRLVVKLQLQGHAMADRSILSHMVLIRSSAHLIYLENGETSTIIIEQTLQILAD